MTAPMALFKSFCLDNRRVKRSARTKNERESQQLAGRVDRRLRMVEQGDRAIPDGIDVAAFLFSDGELAQKPELPRTLTQNWSTVTWGGDCRPPDWARQHPIGIGGIFKTASRRLGALASLDNRFVARRLSCCNLSPHGLSRSINLEQGG